MPKQVFDRKFRQNLRRMDKRLKVYLADPENEENIHDIRTAIRRVDANISILPKKARKEYAGKLECYKTFLKFSSEARDCDIIAGRIAAIGELDTSNLVRKKRVELARATRIASSCKKLPRTKLDDSNDERVEKVAKRLIKKLVKELPLVLSDPSKIKQLHDVRKRCRRLRYVLEVASADDNKKYQKKISKVTSKEIELKELQVLLGLIHDCDVTIEYLRAKPEWKSFLEREIANRMQLYTKFVRYVRN